VRRLAVANGPNIFQMLLVWLVETVVRSHCLQIVPRRGYSRLNESGLWLATEVAQEQPIGSCVLVLMIRAHWIIIIIIIIIIKRVRLKCHKIQKTARTLYKSMHKSMHSESSTSKDTSMTPSFGWLVAWLIDWWSGRVVSSTSAMTKKLPNVEGGGWRTIQQGITVTTSSFFIHHWHPKGNGTASFILAPQCQ